MVLSVLDRYICICWPLRYDQIVTSRRLVVAWVVTVALNVMRTCFIVFPDMDFYYNAIIAICVSDFNTKLGTATSIVFTAASFTTIFICLVRIIKDISRSQRLVHPRSASEPSTVLKFSFTIALAAGVFCLSYVPLVVVTLCNLILGKENIPVGFFKFSMVALLSNSLWNVIIYAKTYLPFKNALVKMVCRGYYRRQRQMDVTVVMGHHLSD